MSFIPPAVKAKRNAVNFSYNVGRGKLDYPSLFFPFSFFLSFFDFIPRFVIVFVQASFGDSDFGDSVASSLILEIFSLFRFYFLFYSVMKERWAGNAICGGRNSENAFPVSFPGSLYLFFFFFFPIVSRVKRRVEVEKVGLYAFFTRNQEPRSCSGGWV